MFSTSSKSQIALEYVWRRRACASHVAAFWVHAGSPARFLESYRRIAQECQIQGRDDPNLDVLQLVGDLRAPYPYFTMRLVYCDIVKTVELF